LFVFSQLVFFLVNGKHHYYIAFSLQGLALTPQDGWSVHAVAHVHEMKAEVDKGLKFMASTEKDWIVSFRKIV